MSTSTNLYNIPIWKNLSTENLPNETWKPLINHEHSHEISNLGRLKSINRIIINSNGIKTKHIGKIMSASKDKDGYLFNAIRKDGVSKSVRRHRAVLSTFSKNINNKPQVNHIDADKENNVLLNLEWATSMENIQHSIKNKLQKFLNGSDIGTSKLKEEDVLYIRENYKKGNGRELCKMFNVKPTCISHIVNRHRWKHI